MNIELSEIDGQLLYYRSSFEVLPESSAISKDRLASQADQSSQAAPTLAGLCPADQRPLTSQRLRCMAHVLGIGEGKNGWRIREDGESSAGEPVWRLENTIEDTPCQYYGAYLEVAVVDARVLKYGLLEQHCAHGPAPKRPIVRTMRQE